MSAGTPAPAPAFLADPALRLILFGGKGGVGKTTCASATAIHRALANPSSAVALVSTDPAHSTRDCVGAAQDLPRNLEVIEIDAKAEHEAFIRDHGAALAEIATRGTFLDKADVDQFLALSVPGVDELAAFLAIARWAQDRRFDLLVIDTAPTGHALRLLETATFLAGWIDALDTLLAKHRFLAEKFGKRTGADACDRFIDDMRVRVGTLTSLLTDRARCRFVPVLLAETLSIEETTDLLARLDALGVAAEEGVVNRLIPAGESAPSLAGARVRQQALTLSLPEPIRKLALWGLPLTPAETRGPEALRALAGLFMDPRALDAWARAHAAPVAPVPPPRVTGRADLPSLAGPKLLVVAGKGGVGKTTVSASLALALAAGRPDRKTLIASTDPAHSLGDALDLPLRDEPTLIAPGLWAMELDASSELERLKDQYRAELERIFGDSEGFELAFDREALERLLDLAPPGLDEVMALVRLIDLLDEKKPAFDGIVLDTAPSGHTLRLLTLPELIERWLAGIFRVLLKYQKMARLPTLQKRLVEISRGVKRIRAILTGGREAIVLPVAIATELAVAETGDLCRACAEANIPTGPIVVNMLTAEDDPGPLAASLVRREAAALASLERIAGRSGVVRIRRGEPPRGVETLSALGQSLIAPARLAKAA